MSGFKQTTFWVGIWRTRYTDIKTKQGEGGRLSKGRGELGRQGAEDTSNFSLQPDVSCTYWYKSAIWLWCQCSNQSLSIVCWWHADPWRGGIRQSPEIARLARFGLGLWQSRQSQGRRQDHHCWSHDLKTPERAPGCNPPHVLYLARLLDEQSPAPAQLRWQWRLAGRYLTGLNGWRPLHYWGPHVFCGFRIWDSQGGRQCWPRACNGADDITVIISWLHWRGVGWWVLKKPHQIFGPKLCIVTCQ